MNDAQLLETVRARSGAPVVAPRDAAGELRPLTEQEREMLKRFVALGYPYPVRVASGILREMTTLFEFEEPKPGPEHEGYVPAAEDVPSTTEAAASAAPITED